MIKKEEYRRRVFCGRIEKLSSSAGIKVCSPFSRCIPGVITLAGNFPFWFTSLPAGIFYCPFFAGKITRRVLKVLPQRPRTLLPPPGKIERGKSVGRVYPLVGFPPVQIEEVEQTEDSSYHCSVTMELRFITFTEPHRGGKNGKTKAKGEERTWGRSSSSVQWSQVTRINHPGAVVSKFHKVPGERVIRQL